MTWFKKILSIEGTSVKSGQLPAEISIGNLGEIRMFMREFPTEMNIKPQLCIEATVEKQPTTQLQNMFSEYENGFLPIDDPTVVDLPYRLSLGDEEAINADRRIPERWVIPLKIMPRAFQTFSQMVDNETSLLARNFAKTIRWLQGAAGPANSFASVSYEFSSDFRNWAEMPSSLSGRVSLQYPLDVSLTQMDVVKLQLLSGTHEPLAHELIREARDIHQASAKSSLLIAITSLEIGLKARPFEPLANPHCLALEAE